MAGKTTFEVTMAMVDKVPLTYVDSATIQKQENATRGTKTLGVTNPSVEIPVPTFEWQETPDKAKGTVTLAITKVAVAVTVKANVMIDKAIDRKSACHQHVSDHEGRHLKAYKDGAAAQSAAVRRAVADATAPNLKAPVAVAAKDVAKFKERQEKRIGEALDKAVIEAMKAIKADSLAIHTPEELKKTNGVCAAWLTTP